MKKKKYIIVIFIVFFVINLGNYLIKNKYDVNLIEYLEISQPLTKKEKQWLKNHGDIIYGAGKSTPPYRFLDADNCYKGMTIDYLNAISIEQGLQFEAEALTWTDALEKLKSGEIDLCDMAPSEERSKDYLFSNPIYKSTGVIVTRKENEDIKNIWDLDNKTIIVPLGDYNNSFLKRNIKDAKYVYVNNINEALKELKKGKADAVVGNEAVCMYFIQENNYINDLKISKEEIYENDVAFAISKEDEILVDIMNKGIYSLKKNHIIEKTQQKWFGLYFDKINAEEKQIDLLQMLLNITFSFVILINLIYIFNRWHESDEDNEISQLEKKDNELEAALEVFNGKVLIVNNRGKISRGNKRFCDYCDFTQEECYKKKIYEIDDMFKCIWETLNNKSDKEIPFEIDYKNRIYKIKVKNIKNVEDLEDNDMLIIIKDITNIKVREKQFLQSEKMSIIGHISAGVIHELRNPLATIRSYAYLLKKKDVVEDEELYKKSIENIDMSVDIANEIVSNFLNFSAISGEEIKGINIRGFLLSILQLETNIMKKANIEVILSCENIFINTNEESLKHIFINLITNAIDAMPDGGTIEITCIDNGEFIQIDFTDTGLGIEKSNLDNIFNPFFTTKNREKGTGLGLFIVNNEVKKLGGKIKVIKSEVNKGTTFRIEIPKGGK